MNVDELVSIAIIACLINGNYLEAAIVCAIMVTGEPIPKHKKIDDEVWAGTINTDGFIRINTQRVGQDSTMGKTINMVITAENSKIESNKIVDQYAAWFTPVILTAAIITYIMTDDVTRSITVLIVGCPCAFLLAGPVATVSAIGRAAKEVVNIPGKGVKGRVGQYDVEILTTDKFIEEGFTTVKVVMDKKTQGYICMQDQIRPFALETITGIKKFGIRDIAVISGDQKAPVKNICSQLKIDRFFACQSPEDKLQHIFDYNKGKLVYVGDGINDAPALKASDTGIAMGLNGSDAAL